ncbi:hypothetical protein FisN_9Lu067 [Fistulifera solaris]|uniref:Uncharacterized protein n=1 Tax=Fistulifera solaris TaxID=1519565 RepID=A0A1Z5KKH9_FISSO|nr:hypothetical protein FisN_9Lu067 [Fistulifera solaris]|eukprot:GAX26776.1 hypothetical protein FisN_9Lu067 [Fistulifera solaris]
MYSKTAESHYRKAGNMALNARPRSVVNSEKASQPHTQPPKIDRGCLINLYLTLLINVDAIPEFLSSPATGDEFSLTRLENGLWDVVVTAYKRNQAKTIHDPEHIDLTASSDEEAETPFTTKKAEDALFGVDGGANDTVEDKGVGNAEEHEVASVASTANMNITKAVDSESDDSSVDYGLSQDFLLMAEIIGDRSENLDD